jgi:hypothetical protein
MTAFHVTMGVAGVGGYKDWSWLKCEGDSAMEKLLGWGWLEVWGNGFGYRESEGCF